MHTAENRSRRRRAVSALVIVACLSILAAACGSRGDDSSSAAGGTGGGGGGGTSDPYRIAYIADITGPLAGTLGTAPAGFQAYIDAVNADGGIDGRRIEVQLLDAKSTPEGAQAEVRAAIDSNPLAIMHAITSNSLGSVQDLLEASGRATISASVLDSLVDPPQDWYFTTELTGDQQTTAMIDKASQLVDGLQGKNVSIVSTESAAIDAMVDLIEDKADGAGFSVVAPQRIAIQVPSFASQAPAVVNAGADVVFVLAVGTDSVTVVRGLEQAGFEGPIISATSGAAPDVLEVLASGNYYALRGAPLPEDRPGLEAVAEDVSTSWWTNAWNQAHVLVEAMRTCGATCEPGDVGPAIETLDIAPLEDASFGSLSFSAERHGGLTAAQFYRWSADDGTVVEDGDPVALGASA